MELIRRLMWTLSYNPYRVFSRMVMTSGASQEVMSTPQDFSESTVILGAGVIGLSTAYYLALALNESLPQLSHPSKNPPIVVIDPSQEVCPG
ncbi:hypothetical protein IFR05_017188, partial [Cadophora sp. M221]